MSLLTAVQELKQSGHEITSFSAVGDRFGRRLSLDLRLTVMASHTRTELRDAARVIAKCVTVMARDSDAPRAASAANGDRDTAPGRVFDGLRDAA